MINRGWGGGAKLTDDGETWCSSSHRKRVMVLEVGMDGKSLKEL